jgi:hypothetical protein
LGSVQSGARKLTWMIGRPWRLQLSSQLRLVVPLGQQLTCLRS